MRGVESLFSLDFLSCIVAEVEDVVPPGLELSNPYVKKESFQQWGAQDVGK
jgi:hypothetical protein